MKSVLVTGSSSGIGRATALRLDAYGWRVFAAVRSEADAARLEREGSRNLHTVILDISDDVSVERAALYVMDRLDAGLDGLVNNAGIALQTPMELVSREALDRLFDINVYGHVACTQAFLPALRAARGRLVFISSVQGRLPPIPLFGPYCASKRAIEAVAETLRLELRDEGLKVIVVAPGTIDTAIWPKAAATIESMRERLDAVAVSRYEQAFDRGTDLVSVAQRIAVSPQRVARIVARALDSRRPRKHYAVGDARFRLLAEKPLPVFLRQTIMRNVVSAGARIVRDSEDVPAQASARRII